MSEATLNRGSEAEVMAGEWTPFSCNITREVSEVFEAALKDFVGASYSPLSFATQFVAGVNYSFFCNTKGSYPNAPNQAAIVEIYKPLDGPAHITEITIIKNGASRR